MPFRFAKKIPLMLALLIFLGCYRAPVEPVATDTERNKLLLSEEKMLPLLVDVHLAEGLLIGVPQASTKDSLAGIYYGQIFAMHGVERAQFDYTMQRYMQNPEALHALYERVLQKIQLEEQTTAGGGKR